LHVDVHGIIVSQLSYTGRTLKDLSIKWSDQTTFTDVVRTLGCNGFKNSLLTTWCMRMFLQLYLIILFCLFPLIPDSHPNIFYSFYPLLWAFMYLFQVHRQFLLSYQGSSYCLSSRYISTAQLLFRVLIAWFEHILPISLEIAYYCLF
jgi:hypothetical protein